MPTPSVSLPIAVAFTPTLDDLTHAYRRYTLDQFRTWKA